jgi:hypothetical protein
LTRALSTFDITLLEVRAMQNVLIIIDLVLEEARQRGKQLEVVSLFEMEGCVAALHRLEDHDSQNISSFVKMVLDKYFDEEPRPDTVEVLQAPIVFNFS